jgi:transcriptional regulator with XRE-family HTH domain
MYKTVDVSQKFKIALAIRGITGRDFAKSLGVSQCAISAFVNGRSYSARVNAKIAAFINDNVPRDLLACLDRLSDRK